MAPRGESIDPSAESREKPQSVKLTREILFLAEQAAADKLPVLPGKEWSLRYTVDQESRSEKIQGLLEGKYTAEEVASDLRPDALIYDIQDLEESGIEAVSARIRDLTAYISNYDHERFAKFIEGMKGKDIPLEQLDTLYNEVTQARVQKKVMDAYGRTGRHQIESSLSDESRRTIKEIGDLSRTQKVLKALKANWLHEERDLISMDERDQIVSQLSGDERKIFEELQESYRDYIQRGDESGYKNLIDTMQDGLPQLQQEVDSGESSESMQELDEELEQFMEDAVPPSSPEDPAIPPDDNDEYHTPPPGPESKEEMLVKPIFEIKPPLGGYYAAGRKSYYDIDNKTWSKKKDITEYSSSLDSEKRTSLSGYLDAGLKALPLPNGFGIDASSLKFEGGSAKIFRDQNGCFYIEADSNGLFSLDFIQESETFTNPPIPEDTTTIYKGDLSPKTETIISSLAGSSMQKAEQVRQHILANHFYPGGGDLQKAQALQYKIRSESTGDNYLQNIDTSEYLECYSANTKFVAMMRSAGIPARLVTGHKVEGAQDGISAITQNTGHAWSEIWDGKDWRRFDATPNAKPEDKNESDEQGESGQQDSAPEAEDGGVEPPQDQKSEQDSESDSESTDSQESQESQESSNPTDNISDASDSDTQQAQSNFEQAQEQMEQMEQKKQEIEQQMQEAEKFQDLSEIKDKLEQDELPEDFKEELEKKLEAFEEQMKEEVKNNMDQMVDDGFMSEDERDKFIEELNEQDLAELDRIQTKIEQENHLYNEYNDIREEIGPLVDQWFQYFAERLPRKDEVDFDEDSLTRQGAFNRKAVMKPRNLLFGTVKNPRTIKSSVEPRFMASILIDVSGSMQGEKLRSARKLLVFYSELFDKISNAFGYIRFSIDIFSDSTTKIKDFDQDYDSPTRYDYDDGDSSTVKVRLMQKLNTQGGTNMLDGIKKTAKALNDEIDNYPDYASSFYFVGDGGDTCGNSDNIKNFLKMNDSEHGFGEHMHSAILLGNESQRQELAEIFGEDHTNVAPDFDQLIEQSMDKFDEDIEDYFKNKTE
ncbi:MAG: transglutaminase domain-containing protein [Candidatus Kerfeldbacteria bacterium]